MIIDRIENIEKYENFSLKLKKALDYIRQTDFEKMAPGKFEIDGTEIFAMVNEYQTTPEQECYLEGHRRYIDVQYLIDGEEWMGYAPLTDQVSLDEYDDEKDLVFFEGDASFSRFEKGMFAIFFPTDLHMPGTGADSVSVKKVVVKVSV